uniref:Glycerophosphodiester phosphodiesterase domain containing 5b n=1 Tax=Neolamprologus brichardi TaxID=32507 RepID=A0A3Q4HMV3_NEOBR
LLTFCLLLVWFYFWWEAHNDYSEFNWFLYNRSGEWSDGTVPILATTAAGFTYIAFLIVSSRLVLALCHVATGPFLHIGALAAVTALSWIVAGQVTRAEKMMFQVVVVLLYVSVLLALYMVPLHITSPCIMDPATLKPRPAVIGHQGAPMLAPENTIWSFQRALQMNVTGLEADVAISTDGVPFLMRDFTLRRTTDVEKVFPDRQMDEASLFNWTDLQQLNAGRWFLKDDPFWTVHTLLQRERERIANQTVCSLEQLLKLASYHNSTVVFRLRRPPPKHPCYDSWINDTLQAVQQSGVPQSLVMWTPDDNRAQVRQLAPDLIQTSVVKRSPQVLEQSGISSLLLRYNQVSREEIRNFSEAHINLTLYTVNEPWLYSVLWCSGVSSVSSEASHVLLKVPYPIWLMRPNEYCLAWVSADLISFAVVIGIFIFQKYRMSGMRSYNPEQIMLNAAVRRSSGDINVMKEKLIFSAERGSRYVTETLSCCLTASWRTTKAAVTQNVKPDGSPLMLQVAVEECCFSTPSAFFDVRSISTTEQKDRCAS